MEALKRAIQQVEYTHDDEEKHTDIYLHLVQNILDANPKSKSRPANLLTTTYAVRRILHPTLHWEQTDDLLDLLTHIECIRERVKASAGEALDWNTYYEKETESARGRAPDDAYRTRIDNEASMTLLREDERQKISRIADENKANALRTVYFQLILDFAHLHIYHIWPSRDLCHLHLCVRDYFPPPPKLSSSALQPSRRAFRRDLREGEQEELIISARQCGKFLKDAEQWLRARKAKDGVNRSALAEIHADYLRDVPAPVDEAELVSRCEFYLRKVEGMVEVLESIFIDES